MPTWKYKGASKWKCKFPPYYLQNKSWIKLFPAGLKFLDVAGLLNILLILAGNWLTAFLSDIFNGHPLWDKNEEGMKKTHA